MTVVKGKVKKISLSRADQLGRGLYAEEITLSPAPIPPVLREHQYSVLSYFKGIQNNWLILHLYAQKMKRFGILQATSTKKTNKQVKSPRKQI